MAQFGVMVEAQEGLTWDRWRQVTGDADRLGFASLRVADHLESVMGDRTRHGVPAWSALLMAAEWTERIELATMVSPVTFYEPGVLVREALAVDELSGGRLLLGLGAGWNEAEHERFEVPFGGWKYRFDRLERSLQLMHRLWDELPGARPLPILMGGSGRRRGLPLVARYAREWNGQTSNPAAYRQNLAELGEACAAAGRDPGSIRHSLMTCFLLGRDRDDLRERALRLKEEALFWLGGDTQDPDEIIAAAREQWPAVGTPDEAAARLRPFADAGVELFLFQHFLHLDTAGLELLAREVLPRLA